MNTDAFTLERWLTGMAARIDMGREKEVERELRDAVYEMQCQRAREAKAEDHWRELVTKSRV